MIKQLSSKSVSDIATAATLQTLQSFVKEIVENSLDASSTQIIVMFYNQGRDGFEISDNGNGIEYAEQTKIGCRGATSKLTSWDDLQNIQTHGFRGEALNAISELSQLSIITKNDKDQLGWKWDTKGSPERYARERGTTIIVKHLFAQLPVRQVDFDKNYKSQYARAINNLTEYAIIQKQVEFKVWNVDTDKPRQIVINSGQRSDNMLDKIINVLGDQLGQQLLPFNQQINENLQINGYLSKFIDSGSSKGSVKKTMWFCYVNQRPVNAPKSILKVMTDVYRQYNPNGKFIFILDIQVNKPGEVDFNVSVDKRDIYLKNEKMIIETLNQIVVSTLESSKEIIKQLPQSKIEQFTQQKQFTQVMDSQVVKIEQQQKQSIIINDKKITSNTSTKDIKRKDIGSTTQQPQITKRPSNFLQQLQIINPKQEMTPHQYQQTKVEQVEQVQAPQLQVQDLQSDGNILNGTKLVEDQVDTTFNKSDFVNLQILGQFNCGFIISKLNEQIFVLDQHACDEKRNYEGLLKGFRVNKVKLMKPIDFTLDSYHLQIAEQQRDKLEKVYQYEFCIIDNRIMINSMPQYGNHSFGEHAFIQLLDELEVSDKLIQLPGVKQILASKACRQSIMIGDQLDKQQMKQLVQSMEKLDSPWNCPHGRPTFVQIQQPLQVQYGVGHSGKYGYN